MDSTVLAALISACAVLASGILTLLITGSQERRRRMEAAAARDAERAQREADRKRDECLRIADEFYGMIDFFAALPIDFTWSDVWTIYGESRAEKFDNSVRKALAIGGPADLRENVLHVLQALPDVETYADIEWQDNYAQLMALLRLGGDLAADAARGGGGDSAAAYEKFMITREDVARRLAAERAARLSE